MSLPFPTEIAKEASTDLLIPKLALYSRRETEYIPHLAPVFYNPRMQLNRDLATIALQVAQRDANRPLKVADALTGCGVRGIRFALEVQGIESVEVNDLNPLATQLAKINIDRNNVADKAKASNLDGNMFLTANASPKKRFDLLDLDPFGSPSPFMDSAVRALSNHGILALTATDTSPLCGVEPNACLRKYAGRPLRSEYSHEVALRLIANALVLTAAKYDLAPTILLSHSTDHYFRVYARLNRGARRSDAALNNLGYLVHCFHCLNRSYVSGFIRYLDTRCPRCGLRMQAAGPLWLGPLIDNAFCREMIAEAKKSRFVLDRSVKLLNTLSEEATAPPTYYVLDKICDRLGSPIPPREAVFNELRTRGFSAVRTHFAPTGLKTNATISDIEGAVLRVARH